MKEPLKVYIGFDSREAEAYQVARHSLLERSSVALEVRALKLQDLRARGLYWRANDPLASTEFTYSRFLVPSLAGYRGRALFCDCDFLFLADIAELLEQARGDHAVWCVHHDYRPRETVKMDGARQTCYPRKNWSSLMLFDCGHPAARGLTPEVVNAESGAYLHQMRWVADEHIGSLPEDWNWLEGWSPKPAGRPPRAVHYTRGGPWFAVWQDVDYAELWNAEWQAARKAPVFGDAA